MAERPLYKTKLCLLYRKGHCSRQTCSFAHGDAELRHFSGSSNGRREHRGDDLREKLGRRSSPEQRYSLGREAKGRQAFHDQKQLPYDRGYSRSRSPAKRSDGKYQKKLHLNGRSDVSGSFKLSDGADGLKERPYGANNILEEKLKQVKLDIANLQEDKCQLEKYMDAKIQEADSLASRNEELETQLRKEQDHCKRITSKIKKFVKAHSRFSKAQEELKRSQARLYRLGDQLASEVSRPNDNEEDSSVNIVSDGEPMHDNDIRRGTELRNHVSPIKKRPWISLGDNEETNLATSKTNMVGSTRLEDHQIHANKPSTQTNDIYKEADAVNKFTDVSNGRRSLPVVEKYKRRKSGPSTIASAEKVKGLESGHLLPSTSMAAHAVDEFIDVIEMDKVEEVEAANVFNTEVQEEKTRFQYLPPPPPLPPQNTYKRYEAEDHDVDVEQIDGEARDADINSEVDIERL